MADDHRPHPPTARRLREARARGQVASSVQLASSLSLLCTGLSIMAGARGAAGRAAAFERAIDHGLAALAPAVVQSLSMQALHLVAALSLMPLAIASASALLAMRLQTGAVFSLRPVMPRLDRLDPAQGLRRMMSLRSGVRLAMSLVQAVITAAAAGAVCAESLGDGLRLSHADARAAGSLAAGGLQRLLLGCGALFALTGLLDLAFQRRQHRDHLRMGTTELRRDHRDAHGDPRLASRRRREARQPTARELLRRLPLATLVLVDGNHRLVALVSRPRSHPLPLCLWKGEGRVARQVMHEVRRLGKLLVRDDALVASLYAAAEPGSPVPGSCAPDVMRRLPQAIA